MVHIDFLILMNTKIIFFISSIYFERQQEIDEFGVVMREEKAFTPVQSSKRIHIRIGEREVKHLYILAHPFDADRFRNHDHTPLNQITQRHLSRTLAVFMTESL